MYHDHFQDSVRRGQPLLHDMLQQWLADEFLQNDMGVSVEEDISGVRKGRGAWYGA